MELNKMERMAMQFFNDDNYELTVKRLCFAAALSPNQKIKKMFCRLANKIAIQTSNIND